jgi:simple sugar transport system substrate-binding protein
MVNRREFLVGGLSLAAGLAIGGAAVASLKPTEEVVTTPQEKEYLKAGWIYVGPVGDKGWTYAHDLGRKYAEERLDFLETIYIESVQEKDADRYIDELVEEGCDVIFTTSYGYMDATIEAGKRYPDRIFMHCSGFKRSENVGTYFIRMYQPYYLNGLIAGAVTKSNKLGYVAAFPIPEVVRHINAFHLGAREMNPDVETYVVWIYSWFDPDAARSAAETLIGQGIDVLAFTEDTSTVVEVAEENGVFSFGHYTDMSMYGPNAHLSGQIANWGVIYEDVLIRAYTGVWYSKDYWWGFAEGAVDIAPMNKYVPSDVKALVEERKALMAEWTFEPFTGPIYDRDGNLQVPDGERASHDHLWNMMYFLPGIVGELPTT